MTTATDADLLALLRESIGTLDETLDAGDRAMRQAPGPDASRYRARSADARDLLAVLRGLIEGAPTAQPTPPAPPPPPPTSWPRSTCARCGAAVLLGRLPDGTPADLDVAPLMVRPDSGGKARILTADGRIVKGRPTRADDTAITGHTRHACAGGAS